MLHKTVENILSTGAFYKTFLIGMIFILGAAIGGTTGHLLEQNAQVIIQIRSNLAAMKVCTIISASFEITKFLYKVCKLKGV